MNPLKSAFILALIASTMPASPGIAAAQRKPKAETVPHAGMKLERGVTLAGGTYRLTDPGAGVLHVTGSGFTLDFHGARLVGPGSNTGTGIHITDARNVVIKHADVTGYQFGVVIERSSGVRLVDCKFSSNGNLAPGTVIDESGLQPEDNHGGGIVLRDSAKCIVLRCEATHQWDGIDLTRSDNNIITDGDYSYNGNWGLHLWQSSKNVFRNNRAVWCTTGAGELYQALTGWQTYDAQAVGIDHSSNENIIQDNDLRFGGDGIFIRANEGGISPDQPVPPRDSSDGNILRGNDCSFSPNNAIEVDFVANTIIEDNNCSFSHYGMWLGYARNCKVRRNTCVNDTERAIEIENGQGDLFENNVMGEDTPRNRALVYLRQNGRDKTPSGPYEIRGNLLYGVQAGIQLKATTANLHDNVMLNEQATGTMVTADDASHAKEDGNAINLLSSSVAVDTASFVAGQMASVDDGNLRLDAVPPVIEIDGIPMWIRHMERDTARVQMPPDFWIYPGRTQVALRVLNRIGWSGQTICSITWPKGMMVIDSLSPDEPAPGAALTIHGEGLAGEALLEGKRVAVPGGDGTGMTFMTPRDLKPHAPANLVVRSVRDGVVTQTWPIVLTIGAAP
jgi:parallel beta-helix repeat protein